MNWTENFRREFIKRRGYDPVPYFPVVAGRILTSREVSDWFLADLRRTVGDLVTAHFDRMAQRAAQFGLGTQCESDGPQGVPIDALETFRHAAVPQTEFWSMSKHRSIFNDRFFTVPMAVLELSNRYLEEGGTVVGLRPLRSLGIVSASEGIRYQKLAHQIWNGCDVSPSPASVHVGRGTLYCEMTANEALLASDILPDLESTSKDIDYVHRRTAQADIYFVRNTQPKPIETALTFRAANLQPEIFDAMTGEIQPAMLFERTDDARTRIPFSLGPYESIFVVFDKPAVAHLVLLEKEHQPVALSTSTEVTEHNGQIEVRTDQPGDYEAFFPGGRTINFKVQTEAVPVKSKWTLDFPPNWGAPPHLAIASLKSWTDFEDPGVRYFSGTATYHTTIHLNSEQLAAGHELWLDSGDMREIAQLRINGVKLTPLWMKPFTERVDQLMRPGDNQVDVEVTNFWPNRIIGDLQPGNEHRYTSTNIPAFRMSSPLLPSDLLGPVTLRSVTVLPLIAH